MKIEDNSPIRAAILAIGLNFLILLYKSISIGDVFTGTPLGAFAYLGLFLYSLLAFYKTTSSTRKSISEFAKPPIALILLVAVTPFLYPVLVNVLPFIPSALWVATSSLIGILLIVESSSTTAFILSLMVIQLYKDNTFTA